MHDLIQGHVEPAPESPSADFESVTNVLHVQRSQLHGSVTVSGAKNSALRLLAAVILTRETVLLTNYPASLLDAQVHVGMLQALGKHCVVGPDTIEISETDSLKTTLPWEGRSIRNTLLILGALTARFGEARVPLPGGCKLAERKYDLHELVLTSMGARFWEEDDLLCTSAPDGLRGCDIHLPLRSTGATENALICGALAKGTTRIWNPHIRPEIINLIEFLRGMGARIRVYGQEHFEVTGVPELRGTRHRVIADNMEALSWLVGSVITGGDVEIHDFPFEHLDVPLIHLRESGARCYRCDDTMIVRGGRPYPVEISTGPYPGINSDMQPLFAVYGACARGESRIVDLRFPGRYAYAGEFARMGVNAEVRGDFLIIKGGQPLEGAPVRATDLRAGIALLLAGLTASGTTTITDAWQIDRGYDQLRRKLEALEANVTYE